MVLNPIPGGLLLTPIPGGGGVKIPPLPKIHNND